MPLFGGSGGILGGDGLAGTARELGVQDATRDDPGDEYPHNYSPSRFSEGFGGSLTQGKPVEVGRDLVPAGIERRWGWGSADAGNGQNQGFLFGQFNNGDGEQIHGQLIFKWVNATGRQEQVVWEADTRDIDTTDRYNREMQLPMPERTDKNKAERDQYMVVAFEAQTDPSDVTNDYALDAASCEFRMPGTEYDVS